MNGKAVAFSVAMLMCFAGFLVIDSDDSYADTSFPITGELVTEAPDAMDAVIAEDLKDLNIIIAKFTLNSVIAGDAAITFDISCEDNGIFGLAIAMAFNADGTQYEFVGADGYVIEELVHAETSVIPTGFTAAQATEDLIGGSVYIAVGTMFIEPIEADLKVMAGDVQVSNNLYLNYSAEEALTGKIIDVADVPAELQDLVGDGLNIAAEYTVNEILFSNEEIYVAVNVDRDVAGTFYVAVYDADGEIRNQGAIIQDELEISANTETLISTGYTVDDIFTADNLGGKAYVLVCMDDASTLKGEAEIVFTCEAHNHELSNLVTFVNIGQTEVQETINGNDVVVTEFDGFYPDMVQTVDFNVVTIMVNNVDATNPVTTLSIIVQDDDVTILNAAMAATANGLDVGDADKSKRFIFDISFAGSGVVSMTIPDFMVPGEGEELRLVCIDEEGKIVSDDPAVIEGDYIVFNHNSTYVLYIYDAPHVASATAMALGAGIAVIIIVAAVLSVFVMVRKD